MARVEGLVVKSQRDGRQTGPQGPWVPPNLASAKSVPPMSASRRLRLRSGSPDRRSATRPGGLVLDGEDRKRRQVMAQVQSLSNAADRVMAALVSGLEIEFGHSAGAALAARFLDAEEVDFHWDARTEECWLGCYHGAEEAGIELDRVRIMGRIDGRWFVAVMLVDGDGDAVGMLGRRCFAKVEQARRAFANA